MKKLLAALSAVVLLAVAGCETQNQPVSSLAEQRSEIYLHEGDAIRITFPGAPNLDVQNTVIRRDGKISIPQAGEITAAGLTPGQLQDKILAALGPQLISKEVQVSVLQSIVTVYVDGPVMHPGKIQVDHPITIMEAIMEAGGFDYVRADTHHVQVIRHPENSSSYTYLTIDVDAILKGQNKELFYLAPGDIVHVPQKFSFF
ncbi:MAG TPA: polysaccharide biosynthesis/export family protein [Opitutaceae bacterium]|jgi:polysaccharide export outer membrane protein